MFLSSTNLLTRSMSLEIFDGLFTVLLEIKVKGWRGGGGRGEGGGEREVTETTVYT